MSSATSEFALCCVVMVAILFAVFARRAASDYAFITGLLTLVAAGVLSPSDAFTSLAHPSVIAIVALCIAAEAVPRTGMLDGIYWGSMSRTSAPQAVRKRVCVVAAALSCVANNTPVVRVCSQLMIRWCKKSGVAPSIVLLPLSYAAILGGMCTVIGTGTNLVINGLMPDHAKFSIFELAWVGLPCTFVGVSYMLLIGHRLLPQRGNEVQGDKKNPREYIVSIQVAPRSPVVGQTVDKVFAQWQDVRLLEIERDAQVLEPVWEKEPILAKDRMILAVSLAMLKEVRRVPGFTVEQHSKAIEGQRESGVVVEVVLEESAQVVGRAICDADFSRYDAAVVGIMNTDELVGTDVGNCWLHGGTTLVIETSRSFYERFWDCGDFRSVQPIPDTAAPRRSRKGLAVALLAGMVTMLVLSDLMPHIGFDPGAFSSPCVVALFVAVLMLASGCLSLDDARSSIDLKFVITIGAALGIGRAFAQVGNMQSVVQDALQPIVGLSPHVLLLSVFMITWVLSELLNNAAVAALMFPVVAAASEASGYDLKPFAACLAIAASSSFINPFGYQTNLMVKDAGGYEAIDYVRVGLPLVAINCIVCVSWIPIVWQVG